MVRCISLYTVEMFHQTNSIHVHDVALADNYVTT